ncbi:hypothetical protein EmuJ_000210800 [Echinococcus multilocularis]|uniref:Uncharacterized protein n=1 Tax=Echinococcus multilocularis TaxID=6211 RepID=A0A087W100_ECHMU|nr:hypothetical protein EmuJ_000210800 [Echinococcus multilocularis]
MTWGDVSPFLSFSNSLYLSPSLSHHITQLATMFAYGRCYEALRWHTQVPLTTSLLIAFTALRNTPSNCILLHTPGHKKNTSFVDRWLFRWRSEEQEDGTDVDSEVTRRAIVMLAEAKHPEVSGNCKFVCRQERTVDCDGGCFNDCNTS